MNDKEKHKKPDDLKNKGFYAALYSSVGIMLVLAVIIGYNNFSTENTGPEITDSGMADSFRQEGWEVSQSGVSPVLDVNSQAEDKILAQNNDPLPKDPEEEEEDEYGQEETQFPEDFVSTHETDNADEDNEPDLTSDDNVQPPEIQAEQNSNQEVITQNPPEQPQEIAFKSFDEETDKLSWPVLGEIVMNYSVDHLIYDKTLEQYRTNNNICIGAPEGSGVKSAAEGIVSDIYTTRESGRTVVVDHGNGWVTTYSQLQDNILVKVGDVVAAGQQIGNIASPSMFSSLLGSHIAFTVYKDRVAVNPVSLLK